jgi:hypothetical protein
MKTRKIFAATLSALLLFTVHTGCSELKPEAGNMVLGEGEIEERTPWPESLRISVDTDSVSAEIIRHFSTARAIERGECVTNDSETRRIYSELHASEIPAFYSLDNLVIPGYELARALVGCSALSFTFIAKHELESPHFVLATPGDAFYVSIRRWEIFDESMLSDPFGSRQAMEQGTGYMTEDNMLYTPRSRAVSALLGDTVFSVAIAPNGNEPDETNDLETLRDLALQVIETAELVRVDIG